MKAIILFISILLISNMMKSQTSYLKFKKNNQIQNWVEGIDFKNYCEYNTEPLYLNDPINDYDWSMNYENSTEDLVFLVDTTDNPRETFYVLTDGSIIDGIEFKKRIMDAWNEAFSDITEEEKELFSNTNLTISFEEPKK